MPCVSPSLAFTKDTPFTVHATPLEVVATNAWGSISSIVRLGVGLREAVVVGLIESDCDCAPLRGIDEEQVTVVVSLRDREGVAVKKNVRVSRETEVLRSFETVIDATAEGETAEMLDDGVPTRDSVVLLFVAVRDDSADAERVEDLPLSVAERDTQRVAESIE